MIGDRILKSFRGAQCVVTGGTGMIGRQVVHLLRSAGSLITSVSMDRLKPITGVKHIYGDLSNFKLCREITCDADFVFHIAGVGAPVSAATTHLASHFVPTLMMNTNVLEACRLSGVKKLVYTSSIGAYAPSNLFVESEYTVASHPMDFAGWAKRMAELQVYAYNVQYGLYGYAVVRPANVYGPGDNFNSLNGLVIPSLMSRIRGGENPLVVWGDGCAVRDFVFSRDVAEGILLAIYHGTNGSFVNLGSGIPCSIHQLVSLMKTFIEFDYRFDASKPAGPPRRVMDISSARKSIGYNPSTSLLDGLKETWEWYCTNPDEHELKMNYFKGET